MTYDRTYWRMVSDSALMEAARYCDNDLALVLGERLGELWHVQAELDDVKAEIKELNARLDIRQAEARELQRQFDAIDAS